MRNLALSLILIFVFAASSAADTLCAKFAYVCRPRERCVSKAVVEFVTAPTCPKGYISAFQSLTAREVEAIAVAVAQQKITTGATGPAGPVGPKGDTGAVGPQGPAGPKGDSGGAQGPVGPQGPAGPKGDAGARGATGPQGLQGVPGPKGDIGAVGPVGPQGPTGPSGAGGSRPGSAPLRFQVYNADTTTWACVDQDLSSYCADDDGCEIVLNMQHETDPTDQVRTISERIYIEQSSLSSNLNPGAYGWTRQLGGGDFAWILGTSTPYKMFSPWDWFFMQNYRDGTCPDRNGTDAPPYQGADLYKFTFRSHPHVRTTVFVYDN